MSLHSTSFHISDQYALGRFLGEGAYGIVAAAVHRPSNTPVAIKKISAFERPLVALRTLREIRLMRHFNHSNIITLLEIEKPVSYSSFHEVLLVQERMDRSLHDVIHDKSAWISDQHAQYIVYQILRGLKCLHSANIIHRDIKPSNVLVNNNCDVKICDFGLARCDIPAAYRGSAAAQMEGLMTEYVATRWYRAPEVMLTSSQYTRAIDIWSVGCILAELLSRKFLFPGRDYRDQLVRIFSVLGSPSAEDLRSIKAKRARSFIESLPKAEKKPWRMLIPDGNPDAWDLLEKLLTFNPQKRITVNEALCHPYMAAHHVPEDEPDADPLPPGFFDFDFQKDELSMEELKSMIYTEVMQCRSLMPQLVAHREYEARQRRYEEDMQRMQNRSEGSSGCEPNARERQRTSHSKDLRTPLQMETSFYVS